VHSVDNLTANVAAGSVVIGPANDMISFWIYISEFFIIDEVRLFGRRKQIHSPVVATVMPCDRPTDMISI